MDDDRPVVHKTFPELRMEVNSVNNTNVEITLSTTPSGIRCEVFFKQFLMRLVMTWKRNIYMNYEIFVPKTVCENSYGHLGGCRNETFIIPDTEERK